MRAQDPQRGEQREARENRSVEKKEGEERKSGGVRGGERSQGQCRALPISTV